MDSCGNHSLFPISAVFQVYILSFSFVTFSSCFSSPFFTSSIISIIFFIFIVSHHQNQFTNGTEVVVTREYSFYADPLFLWVKMLLGIIDQRRGEYNYFLHSLSLSISQWSSSSFFLHFILYVLLTLSAFPQIEIPKQLFSGTKQRSASLFGHHPYIPDMDRLFWFLSASESS